MTGKIISELGFLFENSFTVSGRLSISDLFPKSKLRCGVYLLRFSDDTFYIGQAIDAVRRFSQHRRIYNNIITYWFLPVKKEDLNGVEQRLIQEAEEKGLLITNKTFVSNVTGETDLDLLISPIEQKNWLENDENISNDGYNLYSIIELKYKIKYRQNFEKIKLIGNYPQIKRILNNYIIKCLPAFKKTELSFWALSCMPSTNIRTYPRYFCLNINAMEVFVLGFERKTKIPFCFIVLTGRFLENEIDADKLFDKYYTLEVDESEYRAAGADQFRLHFTDLNEFENFLTKEHKIIESVKELNLRLMRKGGTIYSHFHCFDLVNDVLEEI